MSRIIAPTLPRRLRLSWIRALLVALVVSIPLASQAQSTSGRLVLASGIELGVVTAELVETSHRLGAPNSTTDDDVQVGPSVGLRLFGGCALTPAFALVVALRTGGATMSTSTLDAGERGASWWMTIGPSVRILPGDDRRGFYASASFGLAVLRFVGPPGVRGIGADLELGYARPIGSRHSLGFGFALAGLRGERDVSDWFDETSLRQTARTVTPSFVISLLPVRRRVGRPRRTTEPSVPSPSRSSAADPSPTSTRSRVRTRAGMR